MENLEAHAILDTRDRTKSNITIKTTQKTKQRSNIYHTIKLGVNPNTGEWKADICDYTVSS